MCEDFIDKLIEQPLRQWQMDLIIRALTDEYIYEFLENKNSLAERIGIHRERLSELIDAEYRYSETRKNDPRRIRTLRKIILYLMKPNEDRESKRLPRNHDGHLP